ncbi:MAG: tRNA (adenosine(37)-N6)-threonylcarbamoyltransferase complex transferase subunit TsaD [Anaerolineae bacterium]|nr:tRNA (adenosine(37)-N6)-threonylcarbamoyltransferase complex transferase subunit TsaD [Anaerolineae bacterium]
MTRILAIETSCDETAAAVIEDGQRILSNIVASQVELHAEYGGVFPEMASRAHVEAIVPVIEQSMQDAHLGFGDLDAVAVTYGPGLAGSLMVGVNAAKGLAIGRGLPLIGINHLEAHIYAHWLDIDAEGAARGELTFPLLSLLVSGGHTQLTLVHDHGRYEHLGGTLDDAAGEAFDKVGRLLGLPYPGGPEVERVAKSGNPQAFDFPRAWLDDSSSDAHIWDFSFSGLKTAVLREVQRYSDPPRGRLLADLAASFQAAVVDVLSTKAAQAAEAFDVTAVLLSGGVTANQTLRTTTVERVNVPVYYPPTFLCTDNAAMVGACAHRHFLTGAVDAQSQSGLDLDVVTGLKLG